MNIVEVKQQADLLKQNIGKVIMGKDEVIEKMIISLFCAGHVLLEDIPGTGKTTLAKALSKSVDCVFKRVQFTPDLLPSDLTGVNFYNQKEGEFLFRQGSIFTNILLADEINRATPRTQSSLLECMEERQASIDGVTYQMANPFMVIATQNPIEIQGTFPLPEAQLDRFFMRLSVGYPDVQKEQEMLCAFTQESPLDSLSAILNQQQVVDIQQAVRGVAVSAGLKEYMVSIVAATRKHEKIRLGVSPRGSLALMRAAQGHAAIAGRSYVLPDDVQAMCGDVLAHRILCKGHNITQSASTAKELIAQIVEQVQVPIDSDAQASKTL